MVAMRPNHLYPPFDNPRIRRALLGAINQKDFMIAIAGTDPAFWRTGVGFFCPASPMASSAGMSVLTGPRDVERARQEIVEAGYKGERVVMLGSADAEAVKRAGDVGNDVLGKIGFHVDYQLTDSGTSIQRRQSKKPLDQGGWSCYIAVIPGMDMADPAITNLIRGDGTYMGWPTNPRIESLRDEWLDATDVPARQRIAAEIQVQAFEDVPYIPLGLFYSQTAHRGLADVLSGFPMFWNVRPQA
jgi:peptide/nickel transport system substrate-binding protein